jgi:acyl dehydratase
MSEQRTEEEQSMNFATDAVGVWCDDVSYDVSREAILAYAAATNDDNPRYARAGVAPPVFAVLPVWPTLHAAREAVVPVEAAPYVLHGSQDIHLHSPLRVGDHTRSRARVIGVHPKISGTIVTIQTRTEAGDDLRNEQYMTLFYRGVESDVEAGELAPAQRSQAGALDRQTTLDVDVDQTYRYADASTDHTPIHLDADVARRYGLPGIIVHGLCTMAMSTAALARAEAIGEIERIARLAVRFSSPVSPGQRLRVQYAAGDGAYGFQVEDTQGAVVLKDGCLELRQ